MLDQQRANFRNPGFITLAALRNQWIVKTMLTMPQDGHRRMSQERKPPQEHLLTRHAQEPRRCVQVSYR
jgi:hypothetical protein